MANSLLTGVSGLVAHQRMLNVVGNNLANMNTVGYKVQRTRFADLVYETIRPAASGSNGDAGGVNPNQVGSGVKISQIDRSFGQGSIELSGGLYDMAIQGQGFFVVSDGSSNMYTRAGAFSIDKSQTLVDPGTGMRVVRTGSVGEGDGTNPAFQTAGDPSIRIPYGAVIPGEPTTTVNISGNLNQQKATGAVAAEFRSGSEFRLTTGGTIAPATTDLNSLSSATTPLVTNDVITYTFSDGTPATTYTFKYDTDGTTIQDLADHMNASLSGEATVTYDETTGKLVMTAVTPGKANYTMNLDGGTNMNLASHSFNESIKGANATTASKEIVVVDALGAEHRITLEFTRRPENNRWDITAIGDDGTTLDDSSIEDLRFDDDGTNPRVFGAGTGDSALTFRFAGIATPQTIAINFAGDGDSNGLFQVARTTSMNFTRDGFPPGEINSISVSQDGIVQGVASNGISVPIAQLAVAFFENDKGLQAVGDNYYTQSLNSGDAQLGTAGSGSRGTVQGGALESSNVDVAFEFTQLIIAQRGFSANARTITISNEVLEELTNIVR